MDKFTDALKEKSVHANKSEFFVFLPNELNQIPPAKHAKENAIVNDAFTAKDEGNVYFRNKEYDAAIRSYGAAIEKFEGDAKLHNLELAVCYQNRAAAKMYVHDLDGAISDASKAIELNEHYSKAYYRRAVIYNAHTKYCRALQDAVQACILERFRNKTYTDMVGALLTRIDEHAPELQWKLAYMESEAEELHCDHCIQNQMKFIRNSGILSLITIPIANNQPQVGYMKAMVGLQELDVDKVMAGCKEEEALKGNYVPQSYIVRAYMNTVAITSPSNLTREFPKDLRRMNELIWDENTPENIKFNALLCRANMYNRQFNFEAAKNELKSLEAQHKNNPIKQKLLYFIKSGSLMQLASRKPEFLDALNKCCKLFPNLFELHLQRAMIELTNPVNRLLSLIDPMAQMEQLISRFPNELEPRSCLAVFYIKLGETQKAKKILKKAERDLPNRTVEMSSVYGMLRPAHSSCVAYYKRSLQFNKDDPGSLKGLLDYYGSTTHEYAKALEVSNKALYSFLQVSDFQEMFEHRHALLKSIVRQDYWNHL